MKNIILASKSPRRIQLLREAGYDPVIIPSHIDESIDKNDPPEIVVEKLAKSKAVAVRDLISEFGSDELIEINGDISIVAADTIVYLDKIIGKPRDRDDALEILMNLSGREHKVYTGVATIPGRIKNCKFVPRRNHPDGQEEISFFEVTSVFFKKYSPGDLEEYLNTDEPYDKAGAYGIQGYFSKFIDRIDGSYSNVMGLPVERVREILNSL